MTGNDGLAARKKCARGVVFVTWGSGREAVLRRAVDSVRAAHPELPVHVEELGKGATLLDKARMFAFSPFEETLFLDLDTVVLDRLDFGFEMARKHGLACCICECPWARRYGGIRGDLVEYNTGVLFFTERAAPIFELWETRVREVDSSIRFYERDRLCVMPANDQAGFALAVAESGMAPYVLPLNWNFRPAWQKTWFGPLKVWHDYAEPPREVVEFNRRQAEPGAVVEYVRMAGG